MIIAIVGASGSGKSTVEQELSSKYGYQKIISYTTRKQRDGEVNGRDYHFVDVETFNETLDRKLFAEHEEYSQNRYYGTLKSDYVSAKDKVAVLTPNGLRQLKRNCPDEPILSVLVETNLGTRIKRYIDRCGVDKFNFDDKNEIAARVERDFGMFCGVKEEVDLVVFNNEGTDISELTNAIYEKSKKLGDTSCKKHKYI